MWGDDGARRSRVPVTRGLVRPASGDGRCGRASLVLCHPGSIRGHVRVSETSTAHLEATDNHDPLQEARGECLMPDANAQRLFGPDPSSSTLLPYCRNHANRPRDPVPPSSSPHHHISPYRLEAYSVLCNRTCTCRPSCASLNASSSKHPSITPFLPPLLQVCHGTNPPTYPYCMAHLNGPGTPIRNHGKEGAFT